MVALLRLFLGCEEHDDVFAMACAQFGIPRARISARVRPGGAALVSAAGELTPALFVDIDRLGILVGSATAHRRRFARAHEFAHVLLLTLLEHHLVSPRHKQRLGEEVAAERFCSGLASALLLPGTLVESGVADLGGPLQGPPVPVAAAGAYPSSRLGFEDLRKLTSGHGLSFQALVVALQHNPVLDELETGIAVMGVSANRYTGRQMGLRVWMAACPSWGHVIVNRRAAKQGFTAAPHAFDHLGANETTQAQQELWVRVRAEGPVSSRRWELRPLRTTCAYTAVDVKDQGRELLAIWAWPPPPEPPQAPHD